MGLFKQVTSADALAYFKAGFVGEAGSGKTYTATAIAIGLAKLAKERGLPYGNRPIYFIDSEGGAPWVIPQIEKAGVSVALCKTKTFKDLKPALEEAEREASVVLIDSITKFWMELLDSAKRKSGKGQMNIREIGIAKAMWNEAMEVFLDSDVHAILCGREGRKYETITNENGKREVIDAGMKMQAEAGTLFEPSLVVRMRRYHNESEEKVYRVAHVLKDRANVLDGRDFPSPTFETFMPHISRLRLVGEQDVFDRSRNSDSAIQTEDYSARDAAGSKTIALEEIKGLLTSKWPGRSAHETQSKGEALQKHFGTRSWRAVEVMTIDQLNRGLDALSLDLTGEPFFAGATAGANGNKSGGMELDDDDVPF